MKYQVNHKYQLRHLADLPKLKRLAAYRLLYDFVEGLPDEQFNSTFNYELLNPTEEALNFAFKTKQWPLLEILKMLKKEEEFEIHLHVNL
jgi:hypothetical protein